jgi:uncharacterized DUF497 family protein
MVYYLYSLSERRGFIFEFDEAKSASNKAKHGIDFEQAQRIWLDPERAETDARSLHEERFMMVGVIAERYWSAFFTYRDNRIRLISVRRSRPKEVSTRGSAPGR